MKQFLAAVPFLCGVPLCAQSGHYDGQTWVGLLVADTCNVKLTSPATMEADITMGSRITTPAVDASGTRGSSTTLDPQSNGPSDSKRSVPFTGSMDSKLPKGLKDPGWNEAKKQAAKLGGTCKVQTSTKKFVLVLPDGAALALDDVANAGAQKQLPAVTGSGNIFRVHVSGKLQNGKVAVSTMRI